MLKLAKLSGKPEVFYSIQGEGKNIGQPSIFIRLALCNLYCHWCDTDYTWNWKGTPYSHINDFKPGYTKFPKENYLIEYPTDKIIEKIESFKCKNIVITGGEPLLQQKELVHFLDVLTEKSNSYHIEFETNGTLIPSKVLNILTDQYNVSIKLSNSGVKESDRIKEDAIEFFAKSSKANFKFVIDKEKDINEVIKLSKDYKISHKRIFLMPQGRTSETLNEKQQWLIELCKQYGFNYTDRLHILIYGNKRGV